MPAAASAVHPLQAYGYELPKDIEYVYTHVRKTHNSGVFDAYTDEMKRARKSGILTGEGRQPVDKNACGSPLPACMQRRLSAAAHRSHP